MATELELQNTSLIEVVACKIQRGSGPPLTVLFGLQVMQIFLTLIGSPTQLVVIITQSICVKLFLTSFRIVA